MSDEARQGSAGKIGAAVGGRRDTFVAARGSEFVITLIRFYYGRVFAGGGLVDSAVPVSFYRR